MASDEIKRVTFKLPQSEYERLEAYCKKTHRGKTEILREFIRTLPEPEPESESEPEKKSKKK
jgi:predicted DNA-binding protein